MVFDAFEEIIVLTLQKDTHRHANFINEFRKVGINEWTVLYGNEKDDDVIKNLYKQNQIKKYPNCFRCGKEICACENNFLIPQQIACFHSYIRLFKYCVNSYSNTFLFVEDDVKFEDYAVRLAEDALNYTNLVKNTPLFTTAPTLLSLGQNYLHGEETREYNYPFVFDTYYLFPSNVTFAFNKAFAQLALDEFDAFGYSHTSDVYIHCYLSQMCNYYSLYPKISHDLSWSTGELKSNIHPKIMRAYKGNLTVQERDEALRLFESHIQRINSKEEYDSYVNNYLSS